MNAEPKRYRIALLSICLVVGAAEGAMAAPRLTVLHRFTGQSDGASPSGPLAIDSTGALYGVTTAGGNLAIVFSDEPGAGTVFRLAPKTNDQYLWDFRTIHTFGPLVHGWTPAGIYLNPATGTIYGMTQSGGLGLWAGRHGFGGAFALTPAKAGSSVYAFNELYRFGDPSIDASQPISPPVMDSSGNLYGMSTFGVGPQKGHGTVFEIAPSGGVGKLWASSVIYDFGTANEDSPSRFPFLRDSSGSFFVAVEGNYPISAGSIYKFTPPSGNSSQWTKNVIYAFQYSNGDGNFPSSPLISDANGALYGTTSYGGLGFGTVYKLTPPNGDQNNWTETIIYSFKGDPDAGLFNAHQIAL